MDIDIELNNLIEKYNINRYYLKSKIINKANRLLKELIDRISNNSNIVIYGGGEHTEQLLRFIDNKNIISCIIDKNCENKSKFNIPCKSIEEICFENINIIIISSYAYRQEMFIEVCDKGCKVIDIYEYFEQNGLVLDNPWYLLTVFDTSTDDYMEIYCNKKKYLNSDNFINKEFYLEKLIFSYIEIRDFLNASKFINEYIENSYTRKNVYTMFLKELETFLDKIKKLLNSRNYKDIFVNWIDALRYDELKDMNFLKTIAKKSICFENAYANSPNTKPVFEAIFHKKLAIDGFIEEDQNFDKIFNARNSLFLQLLDQEGYSFAYIGYKKFENSFSNLDIFSKNNFKLDYSSCRVLWATMRFIILKSQPCCIFLHFLTETHDPYCCGTLENINKITGFGIYSEIGHKLSKNKFKQIQISRTYLDKQLEYYMKFFEYNNIKIYMSDHGKSPYVSSYYFARYNKYLSHAVFLINFCNNNLYKVENRLFSHLNFYELLKFLLNPTSKSYENIFSEEIKLQSLDYYHPETIEHCINEFREKGDISLLYNGLAYRGIRTLKDLYICQKARELYFVLPNINENKINSLKYKERIQYLKNLAGDRFLSIEEYQFLKASRKLYDEILRIKE